MSSEQPMQPGDGETPMSSDAQPLHPAPLADRAQRTRIAKAADVAGWRIGDCQSLLAADLFHIAWSFASAWTFKPASAVELCTVIEATRHLFLAAQGIELLEEAHEN